MAKHHVSGVKTHKVDSVLGPTEDATFMKQLFGRKYNQEEKASTIFKTKRIWGALLGEALGTMLLTMTFFMIVGVFNINSVVPFLLLAISLGVYTVFAKVSGANLNPLVTVGMISTRRMSVLRGVLYIVFQVIGALLGFILINSFKLASRTEIEIPTEVVDITNDNVVTMILIEIVGATIIGLFFSAATKFLKKDSIINFAMLASISVVIAFLLGAIISQLYYNIGENIMFNPAIMIASGFYSNFTSIALFILGYILTPMIGGIIGFYLFDIISLLSRGGYKGIEDSIQLNS